MWVGGAAEGVTRIPVGGTLEGVAGIPVGGATVSVAWMRVGGAAEGVVRMPAPRVSPWAQPPNRAAGAAMLANLRNSRRVS